uniref:Uncharacterized protein n=1 Tax=Anopheles coluzzii TaxID=1518534 RepID=A0A8W7PTQ7_ANOCL
MLLISNVGCLLADALFTILVPPDGTSVPLLARLVGLVEAVPFEPGLVELELVIELRFVFGLTGLAELAQIHSRPGLSPPSQKSFPRLTGLFIQPTLDIEVIAPIVHLRKVLRTRFCAGGEEEEESGENCAEISPPPPQPLTLLLAVARHQEVDDLFGPPQTVLHSTRYTSFSIAPSRYRSVSDTSRGEASSSVGLAPPNVWRIGVNVAPWPAPAASWLSPYSPPAPVLAITFPTGGRGRWGEWAAWCCGSSSSASPMRLLM